ncbi:membrane protein [Terrihabitans soli]|uniref:Membrane protein n=1 Tax=Terrihabitans soli TaxID=708113 RepID=A0A6S6QH94_9HYPH|nr:tripartite tricarboxylate transporter permease [Terrihabitans soli]BCJ90543.1 membrane protein [Terrihabitans soli]
MDFSLLQQAGPALVQLLTGPHLIYLLVGVGIGMIVGILPGIGGLAGMALILPFIFGMEPGPALAVMVGLCSVTATSDTFSSVLIGVPGGSGAAATVLDGFPMTRRGEAARALSAAFAASLVGGLIGAFVLTFAFVAAHPILLAIGFAEQLMLIVLAMTLVGMLTGANAVKGLASCALGLLIGTIGSAQATGEYRFTFDTLYLSEGVPLVIVALGAFALPEIVDILRQHHSIAEKELSRSGWLTGIRDVIKNIGLVIRCSALGALTGILPGLGGGVVGWISYAHTVQTSKDRSQFGKGDVRGVIGPESANNAKDGADLIPTLLFGIPSSGTMALFLGGLMVIGVTPGRSLFTNHADLIYLIIWSLAIANVLATVISMALARPISSLTRIRFTLIAPFIIVTVFMSAYQAKEDWGDMVAVLLVGVVGMYMRRFGWSRAALLIGLVLSQRLESSLYRAVQIYGWDIFLRPISLIILAIAAFSLFVAIRAQSRTSGEDREITDASAKTVVPQLAFVAVLLAFVVAMAVDAMRLKFLANVFPLSVASIAIILLLITAVRMFRRSAAPGLLFDADAELIAENSGTKATFYLVGLLAALPALSIVIGFYFAAPLYTLVFLRTIAKTSWLKGAVMAAGLALFLTLVEVILQTDFAPGLLQELITGKW